MGCCIEVVDGWEEEIEDEVEDELRERGIEDEVRGLCRWCDRIREDIGDDDEIDSGGIKEIAEGTCSQAFLVS